MASCTIDNCDRTTGRHGARGMCSMHYKRWRSNGDATVTQTAPDHLSTQERLAWHGWEVKSYGCWEFKGNRDKDGYGQFAGAERKPIRAHRVAHEAARGPIPQGQVVRHKCDNPPCINPDHLETGTYKQNSTDAVERDRMANGERHGMHKLTDEEVVAIRSEYASTPISQRALARKYSCSQSQISNLVSGRQRAKSTRGTTERRLSADDVGKAA